MIKYTIIFIISIVLINNSYGQIGNSDVANNLSKYWLYRWRLINDFVKAGGEQGESIPVA